MMKIIAVLAAAVTVFAGCATQQASSGRTTRSVQSAPPKPAPATTQTPGYRSPAMVDAANFGPSHKTMDRDGLVYNVGSMAFPSGTLAGSGLLLEKMVPADVMVGQPFSFQYKVINLTDFPISDVKVMDQISGNFNMTSASPQPVSVSGGVATWAFDKIEGKAHEIITVTGAAGAEGIITTCGMATYSPILCEPIRVVKADLELVKTLPSEVIICDPIPMTLVVKNSGSSVLTDVRVTDNLPDGLMTADGQRNLNLAAGALQPGESREFNVALKAARTGRYDNSASATSAQGVNAEDAASTTVRAPELVISCTSPDERFAGRPVDVCFTVTNQGDAAADATRVVAPIPAGATFQGATAGGRVEGNQVVWNLGSLAADASKEVCATFTMGMPGTLRVSATAQGDCAPAVNTACQTVISGIPAILLEVIDIDDPIEVGSNETYEIVVTNQGSAPDTNIRIICDLEDAQQFVSASGATSGTASAQRITMAPLPSLAPKDKAVWRVVVKAVSAGDIRFKVTMTSDQLSRTVEETESTNQY